MLGWGYLVTGAGEGGGAAAVATPSAALGHALVLTSGVGHVGPALGNAYKTLYKPLKDKGRYVGIEYKH